MDEVRPNAAGFQYAFQSCQLIEALVAALELPVERPALDNPSADEVDATDSSYLSCSRTKEIHALPRQLPRNYHLEVAHRLRSKHP